MRKGLRRLHPRQAVLLLSLASFLCPGLCASEVSNATDESCSADKLGVSRTLALSAMGGFAVGLKTYPQSLALGDHEVVLTFDDGPWPGTTPAVLNALAHECVKATFFLIGRNAAANPALVRREVAEGHTVAHHTYSHPGRTLRLLSDAAARADIEKGFVADDKAAYGMAQAAPRVPFFRFPGFADTPSLVTWLEGRDIGIFGTDLWASDWLSMTPQEELNVIMARLEKERRGILLMHDTRASTAKMLPKLLRALKERGFKIVHLVPGDTKPDFRKAPANWTSETESIISKVLRTRVARGRKAPVVNKRSIRLTRPSHLPEPAD